MRQACLVFVCLLTVSLSLPAATPAPAEGTLLLRYPDVSRDSIAFSYGGDIWTVGVEGGTARRLTSHPGLELFPKFSPDGRSIAFTGQYSGTFQVYVIGVDGGEPRQLTFYNDIGPLPPRGGYDNEVLGWTPDGKNVVFRADRVPYDERLGRPYLVPAAGGMEKPLEIPEGGVGTFSPDGTKFAYPPISREFRTWKRHRGGRAPDVWVYDLVHHTSERITDSRAIDDHPVWIGDTIFFTSDREHTLNLFAYDTGTKKLRKVTDYREYDVLWPSGHDGRIVYENGGAIWLFDTASEKSHRVPIQVESDQAQALPHFQNVRADVDWFTLSPTGKRALLGARGDVFTVPAEKGEIRNLTQTPGIREMNPTWSPDGRWVAYLSDRSGEYEIYVRPGDGSGEERRVTTGGDIWRFPPAWSPDSKKLAFGDKKQRLRWVEVASGRITDADHSSYNDIDTYRWSPDSRFIAYVKAGPTQLPSIWVYGLDHGKTARLTSDMTAEDEPVFDPTGRYLYFVSNRDFNLTFSGFEFDYLYTNPTRVYVGILSKDGPGLFLPTSDEERPRGEEEGTKPAASPKSPKTPPKPPRTDDAAPEKSAAASASASRDDKNGADAAKAGPVRVRIDAEGFEERVRAIPGPSSDYRSLNANAEGVFYLVGQGPKTQLKLYNVKDQKESTVLEGVRAYDLSADGKKILFRKGEDYGIADAKPGQKAGEGLLALDKLEMKVVPREEWRQEYVDAWRILRDWFYDPGMNGVDWRAMRDRYARLVPSMANRGDLDFILGELGGELSAGHVYVQRAPGEDPVKRLDGALLGAEIVPDDSGYYRIAKIWPGENWHEDFRSPLTEPGVHVAAGDFILAIDGQTTKGVDNFYRLLENKADRVVTLLVNGKPTTKGAYEERVHPIKRELNLRYLEWVRSNRERVEKASGGRIGYIHLPNTAVEGNRELFKYFYPQSGKDALIIDDRYNGGGFIPDRMIALLDRPLLNYWARRGLELQTTPNFVNAGPKACLINGNAGSGGDAFPYYFRKQKMGPLIGTRTWGGLIGLSGNPALLDGGQVTTPEFRFLDTQGKWDVENIGVVPDIEVIDRPEEIVKGHDPSLEKAIDYLMNELKKNPPPKITAPPVPKPVD
ncbi:MAG TPA: PDZ domain-containing protein [Thermoanaerobaculia bacterium]|nr:PDZ domain-containing protein [Thermoanaerobaculia bacterium]